MQDFNRTKGNGLGITFAYSEEFGDGRGLSIDRWGKPEGRVYGNPGYLSFTKPFGYGLGTLYADENHNYTTGNGRPDPECFKEVLDD